MRIAPRPAVAGATRASGCGGSPTLINRHCEEPTGPAFGGPDDKLRDEAIQSCFPNVWIASRSPSSGAHSRDPLARNDDGAKTFATVSASGYGTRFRGDDGWLLPSHTGNAIEYFTWLSAKLDSIEAMPSSLVSLFFRNASYDDRSAATTRSR